MKLSKYSVVPHISTLFLFFENVIKLPLSPLCLINYSGEQNPYTSQYSPEKMEGGAGSKNRSRHTAQKWLDEQYALSLLESFKSTRVLQGPGGRPLIIRETAGQHCLEFNLA